MHVEVESAGTGSWHAGYPPDERARDEATCRGYGFRPNTDPMAGCLLDLDLDRRADTRAWQAQSSRDMFYRPVVVERRIIVQNR